MPLNTAPNLAAPDDFYEQLIEMHRDLDAQASALVNAKLILLLANHIGDAAVLAEAMAAARADVAGGKSSAQGTDASPPGTQVPGSEVA
jgi:uncharacterized protein DUF2783